MNYNLVDIEVLFYWLIKFMSEVKIIPVILCGGTGTRLWPLSRASYPKQYLEIKSKDSVSFFQETINRIKIFENIDAPIVICNEDHRFIVAEQMRKINVKPKSILLEPIGKNTAPAITIASLKAIESDTNSILLVLPADHIIREPNKFIKVIKKAVSYAIKGNLVTFGITPDKAETGFGYIESEKELNSKNLNGEKILRFIEKPNIEKAKKLINEKRFSWNSGIFLFKANSLLREIKLYYPDMYKLSKRSLLNNNLDFGFQRLDKETFSLFEKISIDKAIMEKTNFGIVLPLEVGWRDVGSWEAMWDISNKDDKGNVSLGKIVFQDVKNSYFRSEDRLIVGLGVEDLIVIETKDAVFVSKKSQSQKVKNIVEKLENKGSSEATIHKTIFRPWGYYTSIAEESNWQVKKISVKPGESLSLQLHNHRTEHWINVSGKALVEIDNEEIILNKNESTYIPLGTKHRLTNIGKSFLTIIEVQSGDYLGEDDIIRFKDKYGR